MGAPKLPSDKESLRAEELSFIEQIKRQWLATVDALVDPLMIINSEYEIKRSNQAAATLRGLQPKEIVGKKCYEVFANATKPCAGCKLKQNAGKAEAFQFELKEIQGERTYEVSSQPIPGSQDQYVHVYRDRTAAKKLEKQLLQQEKLASIGLLAGGIAHEINNPLGGILVFSQMLLREVEKDNPVFQDIVEIEAAAQRCKDIVKQLLEFARTSSDGKKEKFSLKAAMDVAKKFGALGGKYQRVEIKSQIDPEDISLSGNKNSIIQVFLNIIQNGIQAMPEGGVLSIDAKQVGKELIVSFQDSGEGIEEANLKKIFDPFFTTKDPGQGTGLGLSICFRIMENIGGRIEVDSKPKVGTTFKVVFPAP